MKLVIAAGGTGGHIMPAMYVAKDWQQHGESIWFGRPGSMEERIVLNERMDFEPVKSYTIALNRLSSSMHLLKSMWRARRLLKKHQAFCVLATGSFASFPTAMAAVSLGIPLIIHEQNTVMGKANRVLMRFAHKVYLGMPINDLPQSWVVGNPLRIEPQKSERTHLVIVGGSQGSAFFNTVVPKVLARMGVKIPIIHIAGSQHKMVEESYRQLGIEAEVHEFVFDMARVYRKAKCVICRSGAMTLAEISAYQLPAILIPYPHAQGDHQRRNAEYLARQGAAFISGENEGRLYLLLSILIKDIGLQKRMQEKLLLIRHLDAVEKIRKGIQNVYARALSH